MNRDVIAAYSGVLYKIELKDTMMHIHRLLPPLSRDVDYDEVASFKHMRIVDYGNLLGIFLALGIAMLLNFTVPARGLFERLVLEAGSATGYLSSTTIDSAVVSLSDSLVYLISMLLMIIATYYTLRFILSFSQKLVIYRQGKDPLAIPLPLTGDALTVLAKLNEKVKDVSGLSRDEVERIIRSVLEQRARTEEELISSIKRQVGQIRTKEDKTRIKSEIEEKLKKLREQDKLIDTEAQKTGMTREELFKKYRIAQPNAGFVDAILKEGELDKLLNA